MIRRSGEHCDMPEVRPGQPPAQSFRWFARLTPTHDPRAFRVALAVRSRYMMIPSGHGLFPDAILYAAVGNTGGAFRDWNQRLSRTGRFAILRFTWIGDE